MNLVQRALEPTGISAFAGAWRPTAGEEAPPETYAVYTTSRREARHADDRATEYSVYVYMSLFTQGDPTEARREVRAAMSNAGFGMAEEREDYDSATDSNRVAWTWTVYLDPEEEGET